MLPELPSGQLSASQTAPAAPRLSRWLTIPLGYLAGQAGWVVAECGRQPWAIQDMLPTSAAISKLDVGSVQTTFFIFLVLFTVMLIAEVGIMLKAIRKGPETETHTPSHNS